VASNGNREWSRSIRSAVSSLKELITIVSGLAATNAVLQLMQVTVDNGIYGINRLQFTPTLLFVVFIISLVRPYHGNVRHLDEEYTGKSGKAFAALRGRPGPAACWRTSRSSSPRR
jgi:hypothetical protein